MTWRERIEAARERGAFTWREKADAFSSWLTCGVGEQRVKHPEVVLYVDESENGGPVDKRLYVLGGDSQSGFGFAVFHDNFSLAETRLDEIEDRVLQLKRGE